MDFIHRSTILFFATGAGAGYSPWMPGTVGTAVSIPLSLALNRLAETSLPLSLLTLGAFTLSAAWFSAKGEEIFKEKDSKKIVIDEIAGFLFANFLSPTEVNNLAVAFLVFRVFDIIKVYPAGRAESIRGGFGVILDDVIAGLYTFLIVHLLLFWGLL